MILVIVESPSKKTKIGSILGKNYRIEASYGHVRDLPEKGAIAIDIGPDRCVLDYRISKTDRVQNLKRAAIAAEEVILATDPDREGEAIAWHLTQVLGPLRYTRAKFNSLTPTVVTAGIAARCAVDMRLVGAQQARRALDRAMGWMVSGLCRKALRLASSDKRSVSAGRVQSVALRLVVDRDREIFAFCATVYWEVWGLFGAESTAGILVWWNGDTIEQGFASEALALAAVEYCRTFARWHVVEVDQQESRDRPYAPFTTSSLQQSCSVRLDLRPEETMKIAQGLYESGHITYMRTDSTAIAPEAIQELRDVLAQLYPDLVPESPQVYGKAAANAQEAHEAIRPTHPRDDAQALGLSGPDAAVYNLIRLRTLASQAIDALDQLTTVTVCARTQKPLAFFLIKGKREIRKGWRTIFKIDDVPKEERANEPSFAPSVSPDLLVARSAVPGGEFRTKSCKTRAPRRYSEASLIRAMERHGVGRPSTYAEIIRTLFQRGYVQTVSKQLRSTEHGCAVIDYLTKAFAGDFIELDFTSKTEKDLDRIAEGEIPWERFTSTFISDLHAKCRSLGMTRDPFASADEEPAEEPVYEIPPGATTKPCKTCGAPIHIIPNPEGQPKWRVLNPGGKPHFRTCKKYTKK